MHLRRLAAVVLGDALLETGGHDREPGLVEVGSSWTIRPS